MFPRRKTQTREPHPDPAAEAVLQHVLGQYAAIKRTEARLEDIRAEQQGIDRKIRAKTGYYSETEHLVKQRERLRAERTDLEGFITRTHKDITGMLESLGDDAKLLGPVF
jgi:hypothetical protein